ncbi:MAG TPA: phospholipid carrier-dependent glycosyltransferase, partial [Solirubrobacteraceae bacterium]|nr:phospholipid carrier-dependent glycosyltransferase [Solirubrobacteraceae bacterium]
PALIGFPDSAIYIEDALQGIFNNPLRVGGYSEFLRLMHGIRPHLSFVIFVQHLMGLASGLLLYGALRRLGFSGWVALVPAAVVMLGGSEIFIEHAPLTEALFIFLVDLSLYALARVWTGRRAWGWALLAGLALGAAVDVRSAGLLLLPVLVLAAALFAPERAWRWRTACGALILIASLLPIEGYLKAHKEAQGYGGFTGAGYFDLYARVAPFAECSKFHPPAGTAKLCIHIPRSQRPGHDIWEFTGVSPAVQAYGEPDITVPKPDENSQLRAFAEAAILAQPLTYLEYVGRDLIRIVDPSFPSSPYGSTSPAAGGYGGGAQHLMDYYFDTSNLIGIDPILAAYYPGDGTIHENLDFLLSYERDTRIEGPFMALLLILALLAPILTRGRERRAALLFLLVTVVLLAGPIFTSEYDYRFTIPAFGPLAATAAIGGWAVARRLVPALGAIKARRAGQVAQE